MKPEIRNRCHWLAEAATYLVFLAIFACANALPGETAKPVKSALLRGTVAHAPSNGVTLIVNKVRRDGAAGPDGSFSFSVQLQEPTYAELAFDFQKKDALGIFLLPGQPLALECDASDVFGTAEFTGKTAAENQAFARLQIDYSRINYDTLFQSSPEEFLVSLHGHQEALENDLAQYSFKGSFRDKVQGHDAHSAPQLDLPQTALRTRAAAETA